MERTFFIAIFGMVQILFLGLSGCTKDADCPISEFTIPVEVEYFSDSSTLKQGDTVGIHLSFQDEIADVVTGTVRDLNIEDPSVLLHVLGYSDQGFEQKILDFNPIKDHLRFDIPWEIQGIQPFTNLNVLSLTPQPTDQGFELDFSFALEQVKFEHLLLYWTVFGETTAFDSPGSPCDELILMHFENRGEANLSTVPDLAQLVEWEDAIKRHGFIHFEMQAQ